jgi:prepilin peptidase CpaA
MNNRLYLDAFLVALVMAACVQDLLERKIPNRLVLCGLCCAGVLQLASASPLDFITAGLAGAAVGLLAFLPLYLLRGMAAGDVKLMAMVGAFTGPALAFEIALAACCTGGVMAFFIVLGQGSWRQLAVNLRALLRPIFMRLVGMQAAPEEMPHGSVGGMPYGVAIAFATCLMLSIRHG